MDLLFSSGELDLALRNTEAALLKDVEGWNPDQLLAQSEHEIAAYLADKHSIRCPELKARGTIFECNLSLKSFA